MTETVFDPKASEKFILDATAGFRMMWFNKHHPNCIYLDQRPECEPDIVGDFRDLKQFPDETFRLIIFDPPHIIHKHDTGINRDAEIFHQFGFLEPMKWESILKKGFKELWRVLMPYGILLFKWSNQYIESAEVLKLAPVEPLIYQISQNAMKRQKRQRTSKNVKTLWFCFMKFPIVNRIKKENSLPLENFMKIPEAQK